MSVTDDLLRNAEQYASDFDKGSLSSPPGKGVAIVACMDARLLPSKLFGLEEGDAHIIRNAGGVITDDEIRSLAIPAPAGHDRGHPGAPHQVCGMQTFTDEQFADQLAAFAGERPGWPANTFSDLDDDVRESIRRITSSPFIKVKDDIRGFVYEVETGRLREVTP